SRYSPSWTLNPKRLQLLVNKLRNLPVVYSATNMHEGFARLIVFRLLDADVDHQHPCLEVLRIVFNRLPDRFFGLSLFVLRVVDPCEIVMRQRISWIGEDELLTHFDRFAVFALLRECECEIQVDGD